MRRFGIITCMICLALAVSSTSFSASMVSYSQRFVDVYDGHDATTWIRDECVTPFTGNCNKSASVGDTSGDYASATQNTDIDWDYTSSPPFDLNIGGTLTATKYGDGEAQSFFRVTLNFSEPRQFEMKYTMLGSNTYMMLEEYDSGTGSMVEKKLFTNGTDVPYSTVLTPNQYDLWITIFDGSITFDLNAVTSIAPPPDNDCSEDGWETINGTVTFNGDPVNAMVLANGQYMFSSGDQEGLNLGEYELCVPLDANGEITLFSFVDGLAPFKQVLTPEVAANFDIEMELASPDSKMPTVTRTETEYVDFPPGWVKIAGFISLEGTPLCAMVLANGQYMFSCAGQGEYEEEVPLDVNGEITLFVFVDGLQPYKEIFSP